MGFVPLTLEAYDIIVENMLSFLNGTFFSMFIWGFDPYFDMPGHCLISLTCEFFQSIYFHA